MISCVHTHSTFCDGKNTLEQMAQRAYELGIKSFGFSGHSSVYFEDFGIRADVLPEYKKEISKIKDFYLGKMDILCGIEVDDIMPTGYPLDGFDYIIGSSHALKAPNGKHYLVDHSPECFKNGLEEGFNNNVLLYAEAYYSQFCAFVKKIKPTIIGHLDLLCKFNSQNNFFDEKDKNYREIALNAVDELLKNEIVFEVNTGGMSRGYINRPYPDNFLLERILEKKGRVIITTDTHAVETIDFYAKEAKEMLKTIGFNSIWDLTAKGFIEIKI